MSFKLVSFFVLVSLMLSCGSSKEVTSSKSETISKTEEESTVLNVQLEPETTTKDEVEIEETTETEIESTIQIFEEQVPDKNDSISLIYGLSHNNWDSLLKKHVSKNGNVNYKGFKSDKVIFYTYIENLQNNPPQDNWKRNQILAYWINAYNAFTVDLILRNYPLLSIKDIKDPWDQRLWKIGSKWYNLNDIEHQILRKMNEPRIHFAIVCASVSCPKLQNYAYDNWHLNEQLDNVTKEFLSDKTKNIINENNLKLSKIFKWFSKDFKTDDGNVIDFINQYSDLEISKNAKKSFLDYNWDLNE